MPGRVVDLPLVPGDEEPPGRAMRRAAWAALQAAIKGGAAADHARRLWPRDPVATGVLQRAATSGADTTTPGWASDLVLSAVGDWLASLAPVSAAAQLIADGLVIDLSPSTPVNIPGRASGPQPL